MCQSQDQAEPILCPHCDLLVRVPPLPTDNRALCPRCGTTLVMNWHQPVQLAMSYSISALMTLLLALMFPFVSMEVRGIVSRVSLLEISGVMFADGYPSLSLLFASFVLILPALVMSFVLLLCLAPSLPTRLNVLMAKTIFLCKDWCMVEIFLTGVLVSFVKLLAYGEIHLELGFYPYCLFCLLQIRTLQVIDRRTIWLRIAPLPAPGLPWQEGRIGLAQGLRTCSCCTAVLNAQLRQCPRCLTRGTARKKNSLQWALALLLTSIMLYVPANLLPIMVTETLMAQFTSTIMSGVLLLWHKGSYPIALVIFIASIMIPSLKILAIGWLCLRAKSAKRHNSQQMLLIYHVVEFVGRWSMIDVFVIAVLASLVRIGNLIGVYPDVGAVFFALVVILTMIASMAFDPRLLWDPPNNPTANEESERAG